MLCFPDFWPGHYNLHHVMCTGIRVHKSYLEIHRKYQMGWDVSLTTTMQSVASDLLRSLRTSLASRRCSKTGYQGHITLTHHLRVAHHKILLTTFISTLISKSNTVHLNRLRFIYENPLMFYMIQDTRLLSFTQGVSTSLIEFCQECH